MTECLIHLLLIGWPRSVVIWKSDEIARFSSASLTTFESEQCHPGSCLTKIFRDFLWYIRGCYGEVFGWLGLNKIFEKSFVFGCSRCKRKRE